MDFVARARLRFPLAPCRCWSQAVVIWLGLLAPLVAHGALEIVGSTSFVQSAAAGRFVRLGRASPGAAGVTAFLASRAFQNELDALVVTRHGVVTTFRAEDFGAVPGPPTTTSFLALAAQGERVVVAVQMAAGLAGAIRLFAVDARNAIVPLGDVTEFVRSVGGFPRIVDLVALPDAVGLLAMNMNSRPLPLSVTSARVAVVREQAVIPVAATSVDGFTRLAQLTATRDALYFIGTVGDTAHLYRSHDGAPARVLDGSTLVDGAPLQLSSYRVADDGAVAVFDTARQRLVLTEAGRTSTLVQDNALVSDGTRVRLAPANPPARVLHLDASHVYFTGIRSVPMPGGFQSPQADLVYRVPRGGGTVEKVFDPDRAFADPSRVFLAEIALSGPNDITVLAREFNGSHSAIFRGEPPFGLVRLPAVPAGFPEIRLEDRGAGFSYRAGTPLTLEVETLSPTPATFRWWRGDQPIPLDSPLYSGASGSSLALFPYLQAYHEGNYTVAATNAVGTTFASSTVGVLHANHDDGVGRFPPLVNISVRGLTGAGDRTLTAGIALLPPLLALGFRDGVDFRDYEQGTTQRVLVRAIGPGLAPFAPDAALPAALRLTWLDQERVLAVNDGVWSAVPGIETQSASAGAFPLPRESRDAALLLNLPQKNYTAQITAPGNGGLSLIELYAVGGSGNIRNVSARAHVADTEPQTLILGFVIAPPPDGISARSILLRAAGPALRRFGVEGFSPRPRLELFQGAALLATNQDHREAPNAAAIASTGVRYGAFPLEPNEPDAALLLSLPPGAYTARVTAAPGAAGVVLAELYTNIGF